MKRELDERQEELMDLEEMPEKDRKLIEQTKKQWIKYSKPSYIGPYPRQFVDMAPFIAGFTALIDVLYYWAFRTGLLSLESIVMQFLVAGLMFMTAYSIGFLGVWYDERNNA